MARKPEGTLRRGWTTGACATAATTAAYTALLSGRFPDPVQITLPRGETPSFALATERLDETSATVGVVKDAGDDPDVTHCALIEATVHLGAAATGVTFIAGEGVGTVTKAGLPLAIGEPAINPVPRAMMCQAIEGVAEAFGAPGDVVITIGVLNGRALAKKTWNPRLGIIGGLSILGTTGIVVPYSCSAWIHSIHRGIDVARANDFEHVAGCTGSSSEATVQTLYHLPDEAMLDMGDFAGGLLKYLRRHPLPRLTIGGGFAKLAKLAAGHMDLHSGRSQVDMQFLSEVAAELGATVATLQAISAANTAGEVLSLTREAHIDLAGAIAARARTQALSMLRGETAVGVVIIDRAGQVVAQIDA